MATSGVARRYARALFELAHEDHDVDGWLRDLRVIREVLQDPELEAYLDNPSISTDEKVSTISNSLKGLPPKRRNFVFVLVENHRTDQIGNVFSAFESQVNRARGIVAAQVTTAVPVDERERTLLDQRLREITSRQVVMTLSVDPTLIGGFVARVGDQLIDASVVGRLAALRERLLS